MLHFGQKAPLTFGKFLDTCRAMLAEPEVRILEAIRTDGALKINQPTLERWRTFDAALRNELVKIRSARRKADSLKYLRPAGECADSSLSQSAMNAHRAPMMEGEKLLDQERWRKLEELALGHYFDLDVLITYAHKLLILEKWDRVRSANPGVLLEDAIPQAG